MLSSDAPPFSTPPVPTATDRLRAWWWVKALATTSGMTGFMVLYFQVLNHPRYPVTTMPLIWLDHLIPFLPFTLPFYLSLWVYVSLAPAFLFTREELVSYGAATALLSLIGLGIFYFWPTAVPTAGIDWSQHPSFLFLKQVDSSGNAFPSLHVAFATFTGLWFWRLLREMRAGRILQAVNLFWCCGIILSTVSTRQHVALDALAGIVLGILVAGAQFAWLNRFASRSHA